MKQLPIEYKKYGYIFKQVKREGMAAIYEQINPDDGKTVGFEVFEVIEQRAFEKNGKSYPPAEQPPSSSQWGVYGWTSANLEAANVHFERIKNNLARRKLNNSI